MVNALISIKDSWISYGTDTIHIVLYFLALFWVMLYGKRKRENNLYWYAIISVVMILALQLLMALFNRPAMPKTYYLLPFAILTAYAAVEISDRLILRKNKWIIVFLYAIIIQAAIGFEYTDEYIALHYSDQKLSSTAIQMADLIGRVEEIEEPFLLAPDSIASQIQEYDVNIRVAYGYGYTYTESSIEQLINKRQEYGCNFLVVPYEKDDELYMKELGYKQAAIFDGYSLYWIADDV